jgi:hypothetical protein
VDLYIEIGSVFVTNNDDLPGAVEYVNLLISAVSAMYEEELDTHCEFSCLTLFYIYVLFHYTSNSIIFLHPLQKVNVVKVVLTANYDDITSSTAALDHMESIFGGTKWHYTDGNGIDLHHALLGRSIGGGVASLGAVCNPQSGFGVSSGVDGNKNNIDGYVYWDLYVIAHGLGHNFGAEHTHDDSRRPKVDTCGVKTDPDCEADCDYQCPAGMSVGDATIMSYCQLCTGGSTLHCFVGMMCPIANIICQHL